MPKIDQLWAPPPTLQESEVFSPSLPGIQTTAPFSGNQVACYDKTPIFTCEFKVKPTILIQDDHFF